MASPELAALQPPATPEPGTPPRITDIDRPTSELIIGMVGAVGSGVTTTSGVLAEILARDYGYSVNRVKVSELIKQNASKGPGNITSAVGAERIRQLQLAGTSLRRRFGDDYLAKKAIEQIGVSRRVGGGYTDEAKVPQPIELRRVTIIDSLKHSDETRLLRRVYGGIYWQFTVFAPEQLRERRLRTMGIERSTIADIFDRDDNDPDNHGQKVSKTAHLSDFFVRNDKDNDVSLTEVLTRFLDIIFGIDVHTPTRHESSMSAAVSAASRSACLSRQVGAAIVSGSGELLGVGWNDVPKSTGGLYSDEAGANDHRCYQWGGRVCHNDRKKEELYEKIFSELNSAGLLGANASPESVAAAVRNTPVKDLIEFSRAVHAEMEAIVSAARSGKPRLVGSTLYTTTYPCHNCARHIVAAGIESVYFIEPYAKSLASELHHDSISHEEVSGKVSFLQYEGVGPRVMLKVFQSAAPRKAGGRALLHDRKSALPVLPPPMDGFATHEKRVIESLVQAEGG